MTRGPDIFREIPPNSRNYAPDVLMDAGNWRCLI